MRTKAGETKRYSLRNVERKDFGSEDEVVHSKEEKTEKCLPSGSTKRKRTKPEKTLNNKRLNVEVVPEQEVTPKIIELEQAQREEKAIEVLVEAKEKENNKQKDVKKTDKVDQSSSVCVKKPVEAQPKEEEKNAPDMPVYQALGHAYNCKLANCSLSKCLIAKQFLEHYSTCNSGSEKCNICKAMDIMVRKHAQICQTALEKCPIPKCDKVRLKVLDEWFEFSSLLRHAKACKDKSCDIDKCKKIKLMFFHSIKCHKSDTCKTKAFVRQLCKYYKQEQELMASTNGHQDTDFYTELLKRKKQELERQNQLLQIQQLLLACNNMPNLSSQNLLNTMSNNNDNHNHGLDMPEGPMMYANSWGTNLLPLTNNNQCFYPNNMTYDSLGFNQQQMFDASNLNDQYDIPLESATDDVSDASISYPIPGDENEEEEEHTVNEFLGTEQQADLYKVSSTNNSNTKTTKDDTLLNLPSPARKIFNKLWAEKMGGVDDDNMRNVLIDLSPDLKLLAQNSVSRSQFISPVNSNRQYSEMPAEYDLACPNDDDGGEEDPLPPMKSIRAKFNKMEDYLTMKRSYSGPSEAQSEWCKIDFVKQHEPDDANKIKDEAPAKLIPPTPPPQTKVQQGFVVQDQKPANNPAPALTSSKSLTSIEQTFLDLIKQQNYQKVSGSVTDK